MSRIVAADYVFEKLLEAAREAMGPITHQQYRRLCDEAWVEEHEEAARRARQEVERSWK